MFLRKGNLIKLKGKASEIRFLHLPLLALKLNALFEGLLIDFKGFVALPPEAAMKFEESVAAFLLLVAELKTQFADNEVPLFNTTEKTTSCNTRRNLRQQ